MFMTVNNPPWTVFLTVFIIGVFIYRYVFKKQTMAYIMFKNATITKNINDYVVVDEKYNTYTHEILTNEQLQKLKDILGVSELNEQKEILNDISYINKFEFYGSTR